MYDILLCRSNIPLYMLRREEMCHFTISLNNHDEFLLFNICFLYYIISNKLTASTETFMVRFVVSVISMVILMITFVINYSWMLYEHEGCNNII